MKLALHLKLILFLGFFQQSMAADQVVSLKQYIEMAQSKDPSVQAAKMATEGARLIENNAKLMTGLNLFANGSYLNDGRPTSNVAFMGDKTTNNNYAIGIQQQTSFGLSWSLSHNYSYTKINNASLLPMPEFYDAYPKLELSLPLWRNWLGSETQSVQGQIENQLKVQKINSELARLQKEMEIKDAFYNLATQQKSFEIQKDSLQRAERLLGWSEARASRNLSDKSDVYQTQALVSSRKLELMSAEVKLKEAARAFNSFLEIDSDVVSTRLVTDEIDVKELELNKKQAKARLDLLLQKENLKAAEASYLAQKEKNKPSLNLSLSMLRQGRDATASGAQTRITSENKDYQAVQLTFNMPLDLGNLSDSKEGYALLANSQVLAEKARTKMESLQWKNTVDQAETLSQQLRIVRDLETVQKNKADLERTKYNNGRSTTYQVLMFEQDYVNSRNQKLNLEFQVRKFLTSLELYK
ncbi:MAG: TolC family protein [Bdellovibrionaceae bacterium]|nr:TolC family protein [Pseudobdellovibrionaceae bacterium]